MAVVTEKVLPFLDLHSQFAAIREEVLEAVTRVLENQHFILGPEVQAFENELAAYVGAGAAIGCASGSDALLLALLALGIGPGCEVITTPFTFVATAGAIARVGARPVFVDIDPLTFNIAAERIRDAVNKRTRAIIPVHLYGLPADMQPVLAVAREYGLTVIEDAAQAIGASYRGARAGVLGDLGCFSFFPSKNLGGAGDGGMVTTNDAMLADRLRILRVHGSRHKYYYETVGTNSRLDALQAAILRVKLRHLDDWARMRQQKAEEYRRLFAEYELADSIALPATPPGREHVYNQFVIRCHERDRLQVCLRESGIATEVYYPQPLHLQEAFAYLGYAAGEFPSAEAASREVLALPIYPELGREQQVEVVQGIAAFYRGAKRGKC